MITQEVIGDLFEKKILLGVSVLGEDSILKDLSVLEIPDNFLVLNKDNFFLLKKDKTINWLGFVSGLGVRLVATRHR